ncbi:MAG: hypothetical protein D6B25_08320 [Desulfobulbaceae bacterium]|nr:MAG: hypothetical protein D6B25_08320 [Desulfobulbaceae bacterium]
MDGGTIGAITGTIIGIGGGIIGTYCSIVNTSTVAARRFMIRMSIYCWLVIIIFLVLLSQISSPHRYWLWVPYGIGLPLFIRYVNTHLAQLEKKPDNT